MYPRPSHLCADAPTQNHLNTSICVVRFTSVPFSVMGTSTVLAFCSHRGSSTARDGAQTMTATDSQRHRQTIAQIRNRQTATPAIKRPARRQKGRTDEAAQHPSDQPGPSCAPPARSRSGSRSASSKRQGSARTIWTGQPKAIKRCELRQRTWLRSLVQATAPATGRTAPLDLRRPLRYAKRCNGRSAPDRHSKLSRFLVTCSVS